MENNILDNIDTVMLGTRLQAARKASGLTQQDSADHMPMARTTLVAVEKGERRLTPQELIKLAKLYGRPVSDFVGRQAIVEGFLPQFRATMPKEKAAAQNGLTQARNKAEAELEQVAQDLERFAADYLELEQLCEMPLMKAYHPPYSTAGLSPEQAAEEIAAAERNRLGLGDGPIGNLRACLENDVGLRIFYFKMPSKVAGVFAYNDTFGGCIGVNVAHPRDRRNWSLAHEYGHFLTNRFQAEVTLLSIARQNSVNERFADAFAACFLMPANGLNRRFSEKHRASEKGISPADLIALANLYQVSVQALILRLESLKRLPRGTWDTLVSNGFKVREAQKILGIEANPPVVDSLPIRYRSLAVSAYNEGELSEGELMQFLRISRVQSRMLVEEMSEQTIEENEGEFSRLPLDFAAVGGR